MPAQAIVAPPARTALFMTLTVAPGAEATVRGVLSGLDDLAKSVSFRAPGADLLVVAGIGAQLWDRMMPSAPRPRGLTDFPGARGTVHSAPATPSDILLHLRAAQPDQCFELVRILMDQLGDQVEVADEVHAFKYWDNRDLLGFVDGTANPQDDDARRAVLITAVQDPHYAGSSYVVVQKYLHDLAAWEALSVEEQERIIGRRKLDDVEIPDEKKAPNSHVSLNTVTDEHGAEQDILRDNMPFGRFGEKEFGTYYIGYAKDPEVILTMLDRMYRGHEGSGYDRILDFSRAVTGGLYFVPSRELLAGLEELASASEPRA